MRGASAFDELLSTFPDAPLHVQVVWEPVLSTDVAPPLTGVLGRIGDRRVVQYWDPEKVVSAELVRAVNDDPKAYGREESLPPDFVAWDLVAVFGKGPRWDRNVPPPVYYDGPVVHAIEGAEAAIGQMLSH